MKKINIAIDGPSGVGKSTIAKNIAKELNYIFINTGLMYRAIAYFCLVNMIDINSEEHVLKSLKQISLKLCENEEIKINGENVTKNLWKDEISINASKIASYKEVREFCVLQQQEYTKNKGIVMEGRDIGSVVIPDAELKIFLIANFQVRTQRRIEQLRAKNINHDEATVFLNLKNRDELDASRENNPLKKMDDAIEIDTSNININEVQKKILKLAIERINNE